jgi:hypothetical protein
MINAWGQSLGTRGEGFRLKNAITRNKEATSPDVSGKVGLFVVPGMLFSIPKDCQLLKNYELFAKNCLKAVISKWFVKIRDLKKCWKVGPPKNRQNSKPNIHLLTTQKTANSKNV